TGGQVLATYDDLGRQITDTVSDRTTGSTLYLTTDYGYDDAGNLTTVTTPLGRTTTTAYNAAGQPTEITDPGGRSTMIGYDAAGRVIGSVTVSDNHMAPATLYEHDLAGRVVGETQCN